MEKQMRLHFQKGDWLAVGIVGLLAVLVLLLFLPKNTGQTAYAQIYLHGEKIKTIPLDEAQSFTITDRYTNEIAVTDGKIAITHSDCPGEDCVHSGGISHSGRSIVCLPNGLEIRIVSDADDVDFVVG